jgi:hypothetical protein
VTEEWVLCYLRRDTLLLFFSKALSANNKNS